MRFDQQLQPVLEGEHNSSSARSRSRSLSEERSARSRSQSRESRRPRSPNAVVPGGQHAYAAEFLPVGREHFPAQAVVERIIMPTPTLRNEDVRKGLRVKEIQAALHEIESVGSSVNVFNARGGKQLGVEKSQAQVKACRVWVTRILHLRRARGDWGDCPPLFREEI